MAQTFSVVTDVAEVQEKLAGLPKTVEAIAQKTIDTMGRGTAKQITSAIRSSGLHFSGSPDSLEKGFKYSHGKRRSYATGTVYPNTDKWGSKIFPQSAVLSYGHYGERKQRVTKPKASTIKSERVKGDHWTITKSKTFTVEPRGFIQHGRNWLESGAYRYDIDNMVDKELTKYFGG